MNDHIEMASANPEVIQAESFEAPTATPAISTSLTFADSLTDIEQRQGGYHQMHIAQLVALYNTWILYRDAIESDQAANKATLASKCKALGITATKPILQLAQVAFGPNHQRASAKAHVLLVLSSLGVKPDEAAKWLEKNGGFEKVRTTYNTDGSKKDSKSKIKSARAKAGDDAPTPEQNAVYISKAKTALSTSVKATIPTGELDEIGNNSECAAILRQQADGSFIVVAVLDDPSVVDAAYVAHGRTL